MPECSARPRARDIGVVIGEHPTGPNNAITDVAGVHVGHTTIQRPGPNPVNTGVTVVVPHPQIFTEPVFAGAHRLNGSGELTGLEWIRESGELTTPIGLTNTHSVGVVRDALVDAQVQARGDGLYWSLPVVGETYDGLLNDCNGHHVRAEHVFAALADATDGPVAEGNVGGGTGMICHGFKGGIGTASPTPWRASTRSACWCRRIMAGANAFGSTVYLWGRWSAPSWCRLPTCRCPTPQGPGRSSSSSPRTHPYCRTSAPASPNVRLWRSVGSAEAANNTAAT